MPNLKSQKVLEKIGISRFFALLTLQTLLYKNVSPSFLETSISESMGDLKGKR